MADAKITDLADGGAVQAADEFVVARAGANKKIAGSNVPGYEFDYVERTTSLSVSATTEAGADSWIDGNSVTYDGSTRIKIEFWAVAIDLSNNGVLFALYDGSTDLGRLIDIRMLGSGLSGDVSAYGVRFLTPSAAAHTYHIKVFKTSGTVTINAGAGGTNTYFPNWYRITKA